ncbi:hypothetical protein D4100_10200 [Serratia inhibens]|uniref:Uncharacterized protein n=1 Tax=Serratia inhibens TaxID=2338073 RepID=A0AA92X3T7_9GAMM|nr:hypothetical protein D4100_10200 [Serratia inhibens]
MAFRGATIRQLGVLCRSDKAAKQGEADGKEKHVYRSGIIVLLRRQSIDNRGITQNQFGRLRCRSNKWRYSV